MVIGSVRGNVYWAAIEVQLLWVDARPFYERIGYTVYGMLEDRPIGTVLYHMKKRLTGR